MSTIKNSHKSVTLATGHTNITGTIDAYGVVATYTIDNTLTTLEAAIFGPRGKHFTLTNTGLIESIATSATDSGILLAAPGRITNKGTIIAATGIEMLGTHSRDGGTIINKGDIEATLGNGIYQQIIGDVTNAIIGTIEAAGTGIDILGGTVVNAGVVIGGSFAVAGAGHLYNLGLIEGGVYQSQRSALAEGQISNRGTILAGGADRAAITASYSGISNYGLVASAFTAITAGDGQIYNSGTIIGASAYGVGAAATDTRIENNKGGVLVGGDAGASLVTSAIYNHGLIAGATVGVYLADSQLTNAGIIVGGVAATQVNRVLAYGDEIIDSGLILGNARYAISFSSIAFQIPPNFLHLEPGAEISGSIDLNGTPLDVIGAASQTIFTADQFAGAGELTVNADGDLEISGYTIGGAIDNVGAITIAPSGTLAIDGSFQTPGAIAFAADATLVLNPAGTTYFTGTIATFAVGDSIDLTGISLASVTAETFAGGILTITATAGQYQLTFANPSSLAADFGLAADGDGIAITLSPAQPGILRPVAAPEAAPSLPALSGGYNGAAIPFAALPPRPAPGIAAALLSAQPPPIPTITLHPTA